jgi:hypothetical protein
VTSLLRRATRPIGATMVALLLLAGCGGDDDDSGSDDESLFTDEGEADGDTTTTSSAEETTTTATTAPAELDPCAIVTKAEAEGVVGTPLDEPVPSAESCSWTGPVTGPTAQFETFVGDGAFKILEIDRDVLAHEFEPIAGTGDEALLEDGALFIRKGEMWVALRVVLLEELSVYRDELLALGLLVADRM